MRGAGRLEDKRRVRSKHLLPDLLPATELAETLRKPVVPFSRCFPNSSLSTFGNHFISLVGGLPLWLSCWRICLQCGRPGLGKSPGEGKGYPLQYSSLENFMDCIVHEVAKSQTRLSKFHFHFLHLLGNSSLSCLGIGPWTLLCWFVNPAYNFISTSLVKLCLHCPVWMYKLFSSRISTDTVPHKNKVVYMHSQGIWMLLKAFFWAP